MSEHVTEPVVVPPDLAEALIRTVEAMLGDTLHGGIEVRLAQAITYATLKLDGKPSS